MKSKNKHKRTTIPLLGLQMAIFTASPTKQHKAAVSNLRASLADRLLAISEPVKQRK